MTLEEFAYDTTVTVTNHPEYGPCILGHAGHVYNLNDRFFYKRHDKPWWKEFDPDDFGHVITCSRLIDIRFQRRRKSLDDFAQKHNLKVTTGAKGPVIKGKNGKIFTGINGSFYWMNRGDTHPTPFDPNNSGHLNTINKTIGMNLIFKKQRLATVKRIEKAAAA